MSFSTYLEKGVLDHIFMQAALSQPTNVYVALCTAAPADNDTGSTIVEPSGNAYARVSTAAADWTVATDASNNTTAENANVITFPTATGSWGTVTHVAICDAATGGNVLAYGTLTTPKAIATDDTASFAAGSLVITLE